MGYYTEFEFNITLKKDIPEKIKLQLINYIYNDAYFDQFCHASYKEEYRSLFIDQTAQYQFRMPDEHRFFKLDRWSSIFMRHADHGLPYFFKPKRSEYWYLHLTGDINYGYEEILAFIEWITPYVAGRKKKTFIGWHKGESQSDRINIYVNKSKYEEI